MIPAHTLESSPRAKFTVEEHYVKKVALFTSVRFYLIRQRFCSAFAIVFIPQLLIVIWVHAVGEWVNGVRNGDGYETLADGRCVLI